MPDIDPAQHKLVIHGMVKQPLVFTLDTLARYPMVSRIGFRRMRRQQRAAVLQRADPGQRAGAARPRLVLGMDRRAALDAARRGRRRPQGEMDRRRGRGSPRISTRSVPLAKVLDDAMVAHVPERRAHRSPANGYPMRLWLPGYEGNMNVKFLRRIKLTDQPGLTYYEARTYSQILPERQGLPLLFPAGGEVVHHQPVAGPAAQGARHLRDFRHRLCRHRPHRQGAGLGRRRQELGARRRCRSRGCPRRSPASACRGGGTAAPRCCKAAPSTRPATCSRPAEQFVALRGQTTKPPVGARFPEPAFQRHHQLGRRRQGRGQTCLCVSPPPVPPWARSA